MKCPRAKCGYEWTPRTDTPKACPMCKQYFPREIVVELLDIKPITTLDDRQPVQMVTRESLLDVFPEPEDWRFTKDKPEFHESGRVYRKQVLATNSKQTRTVEVDIDNPDEIVRVM